MLIPSLVMASRFLADLLRTDRPQDQKAVLKVLHPILLPKSTSSSEASGMHTAVLNMIARPLEHALRTYQKQDPRSTDVEPLLRVLRPSLPLSRRTASADHAELEAWTATSHGSLASSIRHTMQSLVLWASHPQPAINVMPASYTHRQLLAGLRMLGPRRVLGIILDELQHYSNQSGSASGGTAGNLAHAYDVATALVCAPDPATWDELLAVYHPPTPEELSSADKRPTNSRPSPSQRRLSLRETLRHAAEDWRKLDLPDSSTTPKGSGTGRPATPGKGVAGAAGSHHRRPDAAAGGRPTTAAAAPGGPAAAADASPSPRGEHALRLYRRVEAQLAPTAVLGLVAPVVGVDATAHHDILTAAAAGGANAGVGAANSVGAVDPLAGGDMSGLGGVGATDDIFADLGVLDDWGAGMDLG